MSNRARLEELRKKKKMLEEKNKKAKIQMQEINKSTELAKSRFKSRE